MCGFGHGSSNWERYIHPLGDSCETFIQDPEAASLAATIVPLLTDADENVAAETARTLGSIASPSSRRALETAMASGRSATIHDAAHAALERMQELAQRAH
jgi:hypothetical protein